MQEVHKYPSGTFSWADLATTDAAAAKAFYTQLFGWEANDVPAGPDSVYTMLLLQGKEVAALYALPEEAQAQNIPAHWLTYISVDDLDAVAAKVPELGGTLVMPPTDIMESGRMAKVQDPTGAIVGLWQPGTHIGARLVNIPNSMSWTELMTNDMDKATSFYTGLFGWTAKKTFFPIKYTSFHNNGREESGMMAIPKEMGEAPPAWSIYFAVADCDATVQQAEGMGASVVMKPRGIPGVGRIAVLQDPQGAVFTVAKLDKADPPPGY